MSVKVMTMVFERYPGGGGEMLLALALADHASDDGGRIYPSVSSLAAKTRQSVRTVQYQLRRMQAMGWLELVNIGNGGRSLSSEYRVSKEWLKGAEIAPFSEPPQDVSEDAQKGANSAPFTEPKRVQSTTQKGAIHDIKGCNPRHKRVQPIAPANNHHESSGTIREPSKTPAQAAQHPPNPEPDSPKKPKPESVQKPDDVTEQVWENWLQLRKTKRAPVTATVLKTARTEAAKAGMTLTDFLTSWCFRGSQGLFAAWLTPDERRSHGPKSGAAMPQSKAARQAADQAWVDELSGRSRPSSTVEASDVQIVSDVKCN